jgi:hypothetical protein
VTGAGECDDYGARFIIAVLFLSPSYPTVFCDGHDGHVIPIYPASPLRLPLYPDDLCLLYVSVWDLVGLLKLSFISYSTFFIT